MPSTSEWSVYPCESASKMVPSSTPYRCISPMFQNANCIYQSVPNVGDIQKILNIISFMTIFWCCI